MSYNIEMPIEQESKQAEQELVDGWKRGLFDGRMAYYRLRPDAETKLARDYEIILELPPDTNLDGISLEAYIKHERSWFSPHEPYKHRITKIWFTSGKERQFMEIDVTDGEYGSLTFCTEGKTPDRILKRT